MKVNNKRKKICMCDGTPYGRRLLAVAVFWAGLLGWIPAAEAQSGQAQAVQATVLGAGTTVLSDTGTLSSFSDAREASQLTGEIPSLLTGETLHATTIGSADQVASEASLANLALSVAGNIIGADFLMARALSTMDGSNFGGATVEGLSINGWPFYVTGEPNQRIQIAGGYLVINEQKTSGQSTLVNALRVHINGVADVVMGAARAGVQ